MYLIVNEERRIVAASPELLKLAEVQSVFDLLAKERVLEMTEENNVSYLRLENRSYRTESEALSSLFGPLTILHLHEAETSVEVPHPSKETASAEIPVVEEELPEEIPMSEAELPEPKAKAEKPEKREDESIPTLKNESGIEDILPLLLAEEKEPQEAPAEEKPAEELHEIELPSHEVDLLNEKPEIEEERSESLPSEEFESATEAPVKPESNEEIFRIFDEELALEKEEEKPEEFSLEEHLEESEFELLQKEASELSETTLSLAEEEQEVQAAPEELSPSEEELPELSMPQEERAAWEELLESYTPDPEENAAKLGMSREEYLDLLSSFIEESRSLESALLSDDASQSDAALSTLYDALSLLNLDKLHKVLDAIRQAPREERSPIVDAFYRWMDTTMERITQELSRTETPKEEISAQAEIAKPEIEAPEVEKETLPPEEIQPVIEETTVAQKPETALPPLPEGDLLEGVQPIPIEFSVKIAAEELNLPEDLVLEFINDFAAQGHEYLPVLIETYQNGDLEKLQKTAHMLKGAASNLRIEPMVENLYELQYDNDISRAPKRIKLFAGQLMSLDQYLQRLNSK